MGKQQTVRIEIPEGTVMRRSDGMVVKAARAFRTDATPVEKWRGMNTVYGFTRGDYTYRVPAANVQRIDAGD